MVFFYICRHMDIVRAVIAAICETWLTIFFPEQLDFLGHSHIQCIMVPILSLHLEQL